MPKSQREKKVRERDAESVFQAEMEFAKRARAIASQTSISKKDLQKEYETLIEQYEKLLQQTAKITRISDSTQLKLRRTQEALNTLNAELARALSSAEAEQRRAEEASRFKTELLSIAAHDLKNPLQSIIGFSSLIQEGAESPTDAQMYAMTIQNAAQRMIKLINELLNTTAIDAGKFTLNRFSCSLGELASVVVAANLQQANQKEQRIDFHAEPNCIAEVDAERIREVFDNLLSNAVKYSPIGKTIWVRVFRATSSGGSGLPVVRFTVRDEGQGLTEEDMKKIFGRFQRLSAKPTGGESSTGLGLSIAKQLIELHDGKLWAESEGKNKGATFVVELPILPKSTSELE
ncbi:MAG: HAMP domain-containing sensor histidine kinase [Chloroherpetonaceae bacterium]